ncbi:hypothetical protein [Paenibacillus sp. UASWS1643]|uniref:hypothetical protein n=1 Tax=Paenibacillus sp. UASWS1643 TaxID=2580422 RepID=UPI001239CC15|nr:hypothetical protein [Paenibacillus sp. UASWS1643]KAA8750204.1 hypothetical protein FE296_16565 [Paenibacillus sp. UASWS1643]
MKWEREKSSLEFQSMCASEIGCSSPITLDLKNLIDSESWILYDIGVACGTLAALDKLSISYPGALAQLGERIAGSLLAKNPLFLRRMCGDCSVDCYGDISGYPLRISVDMRT